MATVDYQVGSNANDASWFDVFWVNEPGYGVTFGRFETYTLKAFVRFANVTLPAGATIVTAYLSFYYMGRDGTPPACKIYAEKAANPTAINSPGDGDGRTKTTAYINQTHPTSGTWWNTGELKTVIQELVDSYSYASGAAMQFIVVGPSSGSGTNMGYSYQRDDNSSYAAKLHIEYDTEASDPEGSLIGGKLIRGGLLLHGVLGR